MKKENKENIKSVNLFPGMEEEVLNFWDKGKTFEKSLLRPVERGFGGQAVKKEASHGDYVFYDGPPFATGTPHYGHIVANIIKDVVPRYWTMRGFRVERRWGWDCHGLPIENIVEKELGIKSKKQIEEEIGVEKFNELCRSRVLGYVDEWKKVIGRLGRWADMENSYKTMDLDFMESVWWVFKELYEKGLIYEGYRAMHICPRCETTLSQSEVAEGYKTIKDLSCVVKFKLNSGQKIGDIIVDDNTYVLAWTTTPWTLLGNVALAVRDDIEYIKIKQQSKNKKVFLISGKHAFASKKYYPKLKRKLEKEGYSVTIIDHLEASNPMLSDNLKMFSTYDFIDAHIITHSLGASTILKFLDDTKFTISTLTMIAPTYPGKSFSSTNPNWIKKSGYTNFEVDFQKIKKQIKNTPIIVYSNENIIKEKYFLLLGKNLEAKIIKEKNKGHFFEEKLTNEPDFNITFSKNYIIAKNLIERVITDKDYLIIEKLKGFNLVGLKYEPIFDYYSKDKNLQNRENGWKIYPADFVTTKEGTGVVHIAPAFGEDDLNLGKEHNLPFIQHIGMDGVIKKEAGEFAGMSVKPAGDHMKTDVEIIKYLARHNLLFAKEKYEHSYPHCWRCETPLINYATSSWFVNIEKIKKQMLKTAKEISWSPGHIKEGRFGNWLESARDWSISRQRFWASVIPIWKCEKCGEMEVFGSVAELENACRRDRTMSCPEEKITDLHKHIVDKITFKCEKCGCEMRRIPDVLDCWFESGSMPYAQMHYPFENKEKFEKNFPAQFIGEGIDQTRCWFYYLHAIANGLMSSRAYQNVIVNGIVLAEDGKKMAKRLKNYPDPNFIFEKHGADALRYYLLTSPVMLAENLNFSEKGVEEVLRKVEMILWNVYKFYEMYAEQNQNQGSNLSFPRKRESRGSADNSWIPDQVGNDNIIVGSDNILDKWIIAKLNKLIKEVTESMNNYNLPKAARPIGDFINDLSTWYLRRSRDRFKSSDEEDKNAALSTMRFVLTELAKVMAPFMPFIAEQLWQRVSGFNFKDENKSVHLESWPTVESGITLAASRVRGQANYELRILEEMEVVRKIVELGLAKRDEAGIKVRQPLRELRIKNYELRSEYEDLIKDELNIKDIKIEKDNGELRVELDTEITLELKQEGIKRELVRFINGLRKEAGMTIKDRAIVFYETDSGVIKKAVEKYIKEIMNDTLSEDIVFGFNGEAAKGAEFEKEVKIEGETVKLGLSPFTRGIKGGLSL